MPSLMMQCDFILSSSTSSVLCRLIVFLPAEPYQIRFSLALYRSFFCGMVVWAWWVRCPHKNIYLQQMWTRTVSRRLFPRIRRVPTCGVTFAGGHPGPEAKEVCSRRNRIRTAERYPWHHFRSCSTGIHHIPRMVILIHSTRLRTRALAKNLCPAQPRTLKYDAPLSLPTLIIGHPFRGAPQKPAGKSATFSTSRKVARVPAVCVNIKFRSRVLVGEIERRLS